MKKYLNGEVIVEAFRPGYDVIPDWLINMLGFQLWTCFDKAAIQTT